MPEPLSIATGVASLLKVTWTVGVELKAFRDGVKVVNSKLDGLIQDVEGLEGVLKSMRETFEGITAIYGTGHVGSHWQNIARALERGIALVEQLRDEFKKIDKRTTFLDAPRKQFRLNMATDTIAALRVSIQSYRDSLQLSLQTMIVWNQASQIEAAGQVIPRLNELEDEIRRITPEIIAIIKESQRSAMSEQDRQHEAAMSSALECVRSAASIVSSASTVAALERDDAVTEQIPGSEFGDLYVPGEMLNRWEVASDQHGFDDRAIQERPESIADVQTLLGDSGAESDSDDDLDSEMAILSFKAAEDFTVEGNLQAAERKLQECLTRLGNLSGHLGAVRHVRGQFLEVHVLISLYGLYYESSRWQDAQEVLERKMHFEERAPSRSQSSLLPDTLKLARLLCLQSKHPEAVLQARRALKGFRKQKDVGNAVLCLDLLIEICNSETNGNDAGAYMDLRAHILASSAKDLILPLPEETDIEGPVGSLATTPGASNSLEEVPSHISTLDQGRITSKVNTKLNKDAEHDHQQPSALHHTAASEVHNLPKGGRVAVSGVGSTIGEYSNVGAANIALQEESETLEPVSCFEKDLMSALSLITTPEDDDEEALNKSVPSDTGMIVADPVSRPSDQGTSYYRRKVVVVGDSAVGKTALLLIVELTLIDFGDFEGNDALRQTSYSGAHVVLICFSINWPESHQNVLGKAIKLQRRLGAIEYIECSAALNSNVREIFVTAARYAIYATAERRSLHLPDFPQLRPRSSSTARTPSPARAISTERPEIRRKLVAVGDSNIGKTALLV
ncbi:hypothetical protein LTR10_003651 [Elasticomyces elasticus]|nr:hypothetical protein LTR10_003651 [Elasticomyces elasticus]KAK4978158.1 hypothetical protein LTR42_002535 [Elasticomyces elasticus]